MSVAMPGFRPTALLAGSLTASLAIVAAASAIGIVLAIAQALVYPQLSNPDAPTESLGEGLLLLAVVGHGLLYIAAYLTTVVLFCVFFYRSNHNARALGAEGMEFTPGWAVGWFFVPLMSIYQPLKVAREIYRASDPEAGAQDWQARPVTRVVELWWGAWILTNVVGVVAARLSLSRNPSMLAVAPWIEVVDGFTDIAACILAILVIRTIHRRQTEKSLQ
jgi:hypothetical protein